MISLRPVTFTTTLLTIPPPTKPPHPRQFGNNPCFSASCSLFDPQMDLISEYVAYARNPVTPLRLARQRCQDERSQKGEANWVCVNSNVAAVERATCHNTVYTFVYDNTKQ